MTQLASPPPTRRSLRESESRHRVPAAQPPRGETPRDSRAAARSETSARARPRTQQRSHGRAGVPARGRHATTSGQGFGYLIGWTIAGAALPGSGLVAGGRRLAGWLVVALTVGSALGVVLYVLAQGGPVAAAMSMRDVALDPAKLTRLAVFALVAGMSWALVILASHLALRRQARPTRLQEALGAGLVLALVLGVALPAARISNLALIQKDLITSVFPTTSTTGKPKTAAPAVKEEDPWAGVPRVNVLLIGSDAGRGRTGLRPDTLILASVNTKTGDTIMFSLPRNLQRAPFPEGSEGHDAWPYGFGQVGGGPTSSCGETGELCFINAVWRTAEEQAAGYFPGDPNPGLTATEQAVEGVLGLKVDYYIMLDLKGFQQFIDAIGGVTIDVKQRLPMGGNSENHTATQGWLEIGDNQKLDGFHALWYARSRWTTTDYDRMRRQRCVIAAVADQADPLTIVKNFKKVAKALKDNMQTDLPVGELTAWGDLAMRIKEDGQVRSLPFTDEVITSANPDWEKIRGLVQKALKGPKKKKATSDTTSAGSTGTGSTADGDTGGSAGSSGGTSSGTKKTTQPTSPEDAQDVGDVC